jgi:hypothetical protein
MSSAEKRFSQATAAAAIASAEAARHAPRRCFIAADAINIIGEPRYYEVSADNGRSGSLAFAQPVARLFFPGRKRCRTR